MNILFCWFQNWIKKNWGRYGRYKESGKKYNGRNRKIKLITLLLINNNNGKKKNYRDITNRRMLSFFIEIPAKNRRERNKMYHKTKLSAREKIKAWLSLCDFTFELMKNNLTKKEIAQKLNKMREDQIKTNHSILKGLSRIK